MAESAPTEQDIIDMREGANECKTRGNKSLADGKYEEAVEAYTMGISLDSKNHILYSNRSAAHAKMENFAEALNDAEQVIRIRPDWAKGYSRKGSALQFLGRFEEARSAFEKGLEFEPNNESMKKGIKECETELEGPAACQPLGNPFANLETIMPRLREDEKTKDFVYDPDYNKMLKDLGEDPLNMQKYLKDDRLRLTLSALLGFELERPEDMNFDEPPFTDDVNEESEHDANQRPRIEEIAELKLTDQDKAKKEKEIGTKHLRESEFEKAHEHYDNAIQYDPTDIGSYSNKALAYQRQKMPEKVREMSEKVVELGKKHDGDKRVIAKAYARIGQTYLEEEKFDVALENFQLSLEQNSTDETQAKIKLCREGITRKQGN